MMGDVCSDGVVMMVLGKDDYDKVCLASTCWENPLQVLSGIGGVCPHGVCPHAGVLVVSQLYFGGHWRLGGILAVCPSILTVFSDVLGLAHVFVVFL